MLSRSLSDLTSPCVTEIPAAWSLGRFDLAARPAEVVDAGNSSIWQPEGQLQGELASDKPADACDDDLHQEEMRSFQVDDDFSQSVAK